jgi:trehalose/maltose hydrolase-like predicted phosphorylase
MADDRNNQVVGYPTREIRVTGERCASMVHATVAVSRFEIQLVNMSMSSATNMRDGVRKASERFKNALDAFESEMRESQRELDIATKRGRPTNRRPNNAVAQQTPANKRPAQQQKGNQNQPNAKAPKQTNNTQKANATTTTPRPENKSPEAKSGGDMKAQARPAPKPEKKADSPKIDPKEIVAKATPMKTETPVPVLD